MKLPTVLSDLPGSEVFDVVDSTKIKCFKDCPRKFFFNYVLHWRKDVPNIHLEFGTAWHLAKEHLLNHGYKPADVDDAYSLFLAHFRQFFAESDDLNLGAKNAGNAYKALNEYAQQYAFTNANMDILATEISGKCNLSPDVMASFKIDAVVRDETGMWVLDHKTSSRDSPTDDASWHLSTQMALYTHALHCMYPTESVKGAYVDISVLRKTGNLHKRLPVLKTFAALEEWHHSILYWYDLLQREYDKLSTVDPSDTFLTAFPMNTECCTKYGACPYMPLCSTPSNPMNNPTQIPGGFRREVWNPHASDKAWTPKHIMEPDGTLHPPTPAEEAAFKEARERLRELRAHSEADDFNFKGFT